MLRKRPLFPQTLVLVIPANMEHARQTELNMNVLALGDTSLWKFVEKMFVLQVLISYYQLSFETS